jgi:DNA-binding response OmpR family regulator
MSASALPLLHGQRCAPDRVEAGFARTAEILVAEGDSAIAHMIVEYLREQQMHAVVTGQNDLVSRLAVGEPKLVILDLQIGKNSGLDLLRKIQLCSQVPVITTGYPCDDIDPVIGLEMGADDYLTKPFGLRELLARIRAILRRKSAVRSEPAVRSPTGRSSKRYSFSGWHLDQRTRHLTDPHGNPVTLTKNGYALLLAFLHAPRRPLSRQYLSKAIHVHVHIDDRSMNVQILRLRRKLETGRDFPRLIETARGLGYVFTSSVEELERDIPLRVK